MSGSRGAVRATGVVGVLVVTAAAAILIWNAPDRAKAASLAATVVGLLATVAGLLRWVLNRSNASLRASTEDLVRLSDELAAALASQWREEAEARGLVNPAPIPVCWRWSDRPVGVRPEDAVVGLPPGVGPASVPGIAPATADDVREGSIDQLHALYAGLGAGRLTVLGGPGTGKTGAAILLLLQALSHRGTLPAEERAQVPVPVLLTLAGWDPSGESLSSWAARRMGRDYSFLRGPGQGQAATDLVRHGHVALLLDGLDEMAEAWRADAVRRTSELPGTRVVLLTRPEELESATADAPVPGATVELQPVGAVSAAGYLLAGRGAREREVWSELTAWLGKHPESPAAAVLSTPLMLSLVRSSYPGRADPSELVDPVRFPSREALEVHLIDQLIARAYQDVDDRRYRPEQARRWLGELAARMHQDGLRDLVWWQIPAWTSRWLTGTVLGAALAAPILVFLLLTGRSRPGWDSMVWPVIWFVCLGLVLQLGGLGVSLRRLRSADTTSAVTALRRDARALALLALPVVVQTPTTWRDQDLAGWIDGFLWSFCPPALIILGFTLAGFLDDHPTPVQRARPDGSSLQIGLVSGLGVGLLAGLVNAGWRAEIPPLHDTVQLALVGAGAGLVVGGFAGAVRSASASGSSYSPVDLWRADLRSGVVVGVGFGLTASLIVYAFTRQVGEDLLLASVVLIPASLACGVLATQVTRLAATAVWMRLTGRGPLRPVRFLEDARDRQLVRTAGAAYQFRHATIQDRLARTHGSGRAGPVAARTA